MVRGNWQKRVDRAETIKVATRERRFQKETRERYSRQIRSFWSHLDDYVDTEKKNLTGRNHDNIKCKNITASFSSSSLVLHLWLDIPTLAVAEYFAPGEDKEGKDKDNDASVDMDSRGSNSIHHLISDEDDVPDNDDDHFTIKKKSSRGKGKQGKNKAHPNSGFKNTQKKRNPPSAHPNSGFKNNHEKTPTSIKDGNNNNTLLTSKRCSAATANNSHNIASIIASLRMCRPNFFHGVCGCAAHGGSSGQHRKKIESINKNNSNSQHIHPEALFDRNNGQFTLASLLLGSGKDINAPILDNAEQWAHDSSSKNNKIYDKSNDNDNKHNNDTSVTSDVMDMVFCVTVPLDLDDDGFNVEEKYNERSGMEYMNKATEMENSKTSSDSIKNISGSKESCSLSDQILKFLARQCGDSVRGINVVYAAFQDELIYDRNRNGLQMKATTFDGNMKDSIKGSSMNVAVANDILSPKSPQCLFAEENHEGSISSAFETTDHIAANISYSYLPAQLLEVILIYLPDQCVGTLPLVCRNWSNEIGKSSPELWKNLLLRRGWPLPPTSATQSTTIAGQQQQQSVVIKNTLDSATVTTLDQYRTSYLSHYQNVRDMIAIQSFLYIMSSSLQQQKSATRGSINSGNKISNNHKSNNKKGQDKYHHYYDDNYSAYQSFKVTRGAPESYHEQNHCVSLKVWTNTDTTTSTSATSSSTQIYDMNQNELLLTTPTKNKSYPDTARYNNTNNYPSLPTDCQIIAAYRMDGTLRIFEARPSSSSFSSPSSATAASSICRQTVCARITPRKHGTEILAMDMDDVWIVSIIKVPNPVVHKHKNSNNDNHRRRGTGGSLFSLGVVSREKFLWCSGTGNDNELETNDEWLQYLDLQCMIDDYHHHAHQVENVVAIHNINNQNHDEENEIEDDLVLLWDVEEVYSVIVSCGNGFFVVLMQLCNEAAGDQRYSLCLCSITEQTIVWSIDVTHMIAPHFHFWDKIDLSSTYSPSDDVKTKTCYCRVGLVTSLGICLVTIHYNKSKSGGGALISVKDQMVLGGSDDHHSWRTYMEQETEEEILLNGGICVGAGATGGGGIHGDIGAVGEWEFLPGVGRNISVVESNKDGNGGTGTVNATTRADQNDDDFVVVASQCLYNATNDVYQSVLSFHSCSKKSGGIVAEQQKQQEEDEFVLNEDSDGDDIHAIEENSNPQQQQEEQQKMDMNSSVSPIPMTNKDTIDHLNLGYNCIILSIERVGKEHLIATCAYTQGTVRLTMHGPELVLIPPTTAQLDDGAANGGGNNNNNHHSSSSLYNSMMFAVIVHIPSWREIDRIDLGIVSSDNTNSNDNSITSPVLLAGNQSLMACALSWRGILLTGPSVRDLTFSSRIQRSLFLKGGGDGNRRRSDSFSKRNGNGDDENGNTDSAQKKGKKKKKKKNIGGSSSNSKSTKKKDGFARGMSLRG